MDAWVIDEEELKRQAEGKPVPLLDGRFYIDVQEDEEASKKAGKKVFRNVEKIEIRTGSRDTVDREVTNEDRVNYSAKYLAFKAGQSQDEVGGYPLKKWPPITKGEAETLYAAGVKTVEQLAAAADSRLQGLGPMQSLRQKAKDWLEEEKRGSKVSALREENEGLKSRLDALEKMLKTQAGEIEAARNAGGSLPPVAMQDPRIAALEAKLDALISAPAVVAAPPVVRKGGRPKGSKNKPKVAPNGSGETVPEG